MTTARATRLAGVEEGEQDRRGDVVRQVADDVERWGAWGLAPPFGLGVGGMRSRSIVPAGGGLGVHLRVQVRVRRRKPSVLPRPSAPSPVPICRQRPPVGVEHVGVADVRGPGTERPGGRRPRGPPPARRGPGSGRSERAGQRPLAGPDLDHAPAGRRLDRADDPADGLVGRSGSAGRGVSWGGRTRRRGGERRERGSGKKRPGRSAVRTVGPRSALCPGRAYCEYGPRTTSSPVAPQLVDHVSGAEAVRLDRDTRRLLTEPPPCHPAGEARRSREATAQPSSAPPTHQWSRSRQAAWRPLAAPPASRGQAWCRGRRLRTTGGENLTAPLAAPAPRTPRSSNEGVGTELSRPRRLASPACACWRAW